MRGRTVVALLGPTGIGKTELAVALADRLRGASERPVAISADALQVYAGLETLTGAPRPEEQARLEHRLVGFVPVTQTFSVGEFMPLAHAEVDAALEAGRRPLVVGGTGLYARAAIAELDLRPPPSPALRARLEASLNERGVAALHEELRSRAPAAARAIDPTDRSRTVRALELIEMGEAPPGEVAGDSQLWSRATRHDTLVVALVMERSALYRRIDQRAEAMIAAGAAEEVRRADAAGASRTARKALGFDELLRGDVDAMRRRTRNYARRQLTWLRKLPEQETVDLTGRSAADGAEQVVQLLERREDRRR